MNTYNDAVGGNPIQPSSVGYRDITLSATTQFSWPFANVDTDDVTANFMNVTATAGSLSFKMPPADEVGNGQSCIFRNIGSNAFTVTDTDGNTILTIAAGTAYIVYIEDNSTEDGVWGSLALGIGTSALDASSLAGLGLKAILTTLNLNLPVTSHSVNYNFTANDRASTHISTGGAITFLLPDPATLGNGWFTIAKNSGTGNLTLTTAAGSIDSSTITQNQGAIIFTDGVNFFTVGLSVSTASGISRLVKSVAGNTDVTLTATEAAYTIIEFSGVLTGSINVIVPTVINRWYMYNNTSGAFTLTAKTVAGTGEVVPQGTRSIFYCDGTNVRCGLGGTWVFWGGTSGGSANAHTVTTIPTTFGLIAGSSISFVAGFTNTTTTTLAVNGLTAKTVKKRVAGGLTNLLASDIFTGSTYTVVYDGTFFIMTIENPPLTPALTSQVFTGSGTFTTPAGTLSNTAFKFTITGGGGGGSQGNGGAALGTAGGGGATAIYYISGLSAAQNCTITVGAGGTAGSVGGGVAGGGNGGDSSAVVGATTVTGGGGKSGGNGGFGGTATNGTINVSGGCGFVQTPANIAYDGIGGSSIWGNGLSSAGGSAAAYGGGGLTLNTNFGSATAGIQGIVLVEWVL